MATVAILGAGGTIGPAIVRDLAESDEVDALRALDLDGKRAAAVAVPPKTTSASVDATDPPSLAAALEGADVLVNAASYRINLAAMDAALAAGCHYVDLGGLYHVTKQQLERDADFAAADCLAVLGAGAGPGKTNAMAMLAAREVGLEVEEVRCASAGLDEDPPAGASFPYALATLLDEVTVPPMVVRHGEAIEVEPLSDGGEIEFPPPIGRRSSIRTLHSEVLTLPESLGARAADFRLSLGPGVLDKLLELRERAPEELAALRTVPPSARTWSAQHVLVRGADSEAIVTSVTPPHDAWGLGGGVVSSGSVGAATARMLLRGALDVRGALPPERCLPPDALFAELERVGTTLSVQNRAVDHPRSGSADLAAAAA
ncbi:MAG: saccharopine dehydrogenase family protein [Solirubrobacterales bacterium]